MTQNSSRLRPVIRVFVSSTFSDMKHERNVLQSDVFPKLEELCLENGFQFQSIDLRWGVSSEAGMDHRTMQICFDELKRAQEISPEPNFLVLLGDRYGWRPLPEEISQSEFDRLLLFAKGNNQDHPEIPGVHEKSSCQILKEWYRCDENILLSGTQNNDADCEILNYILQPRTQDLGDGRDYTSRKHEPTKNTQDWIDVQEVLWNIINTAFPFEFLNQRFDRDWKQHLADVHNLNHPKRSVPQIARFQASATEQEIWCGALSALNAENHVLACYREITNRDDFSTSELADFYNLKESGEFDSFSFKCQSDLKTAIRHRLGENVPIGIPFNRLKREHDKLAIETTDATTKKFCEDVFNRIKPIIERQIEEYWEKSKPSSAERVTRELNIERYEHKRFGTERGGKKSFVGRNPELQVIRDYLNSNSPWPLVVHGASGCGKTALLARAFEEIREDQKPIIRFIGTTPYSSDIRSLLLSLCKELRERYPRADMLPSDAKELQKEFLEQLNTIAPEQSLILFLDALDQLSDADNGRLLNWIPYGQLPSNVRLVISCLSDRPKKDPSGQPFTELTRRQLIEKNSINLDALSEEEAKILLFRNWLPQVGRKLSDLQRKCIEKTLGTNDCCQPIYLKLLFEEVRLWRSYDAVPKIGENLPALLQQLFERLSLKTNHGKLLVERVLGYLSASRYGLAENEILEMLFDDPDYKAKLKEDNKRNLHELPVSATRIPIAIWSRLRFDLAPYLTERSALGANVLTFYHRQVGEWIHASYLKKVLIDWNPHERLADFFERKADPGNDSTWKGTSSRALEELPYHLAQNEYVPRWERLLCDPLFIESTCRAGLVYEFLRDTDAALIRLQSESVQIMRKAVASSLRTITNHPEFSLSIICNHLLWSEPNGLIAQSAKHATAVLDEFGTWLQAASPLPMVESIPLEDRFHQSFIAKQQAFATVHGSGNLEIRNILRGELLAKRTLPSRTLTAFSVEPAQFLAAWLERNGDIRAEISQSTLLGRVHETEVAYPRDDAVIAVSQAGNLVAWNPKEGETTILSTEVPFPLVVLRANPEGSRIFFVAGDRLSSQKLEVVTKNGGGWETSTIRWNGRTVKNGCCNPDGTRVLLIDSGRGISIVEIATGIVLASTQYEQRRDVMAWGAITACALGKGQEDEIAVVTTDKGQVWAWNWKQDSFTACGNYKRLQESETVRLLEFVPEGNRIFISTDNRAAFFSIDGEMSIVPHSAAVTDCTITDSGLVASICREERALKWWRFDGMTPMNSFPVEPPRILAADANDDCVFLGTDNGLLYRFPATRTPESKDIFKLFDHPVANIVSDSLGVAIAASTQGLIERVDFLADRSDWLFSHTSGHRQRWLLPRSGGAYIAVRELDTAGRGDVVAIGKGQNDETELYKSKHSAVLVSASRDREHVVIYDRESEDNHALKVFKLEGYELIHCFTVRANRSICAVHLLLGDKYLLLTKRDEPWLELRRLKPGLPLVAVMELPSAPSCICTRQEKIAIGFQSGDILCLRVQDNNYKRSINKD